VSSWWTGLVEAFKKEKNEIKMLANNDVKVPLEKVYEFLVKKRLVSDRQGGIKLLNI